MNKTTWEIGLRRWPKPGYLDMATERHNTDGR